MVRYSQRWRDRMDCNRVGGVVSESTSQALSLPLGFAACGDIPMLLSIFSDPIVCGDGTVFPSTRPANPVGLRHFANTSFEAGEFIVYPYNVIRVDNDGIRRFCCFRF